MKHLERVQQWNATASSYPREAALPELFGYWTRHTPDAIAIVGGDTQLTYRELDERANALACALHDEGVKVGDRVGVLGPRCTETIVAIVACLKVGVVYVPLDAAQPSTRLQAMADDTRLDIVVETPGGTDVLPGITRVLWTGEERRSRPPIPVRPLHGDDLAYIMFTSGSTGRPKAVGVRHRGISRLVLNTNYVKITNADRLLQIGTISFDFSTFEIWGALLNGAALTVLPSRLLFSPDDFRDRLDRYRITIAAIPTAVFHQLARSRPEVFSGLRCLFVGGEELDIAHARDVLASGGPPQRLVNIYGPTENTSFTTAYAVNDLPADAVTVPIGTPISNSTCYVLREDGGLADIGEVGELVIGGDGVAAGYLNDPALTKQRFVPDVFGGDPSRRLYRTGDMACWREDGTIEFRGRRDTQFKMRGYRVEASEIEAALRGHPAVAEAVVTRSHTTTEDPQLVAYLVAKPEDALPSDTELRCHLRETLPDYLIPSVYVELDHLPLNPNGKVDRAALAPLAVDSAQPVPESDDLLARIAAVWRDVLRERGVEASVGPADTLFAVGGTSFDVPHIHDRISTLFNVPELTPLDLFSFPTLRGYASRIAELLKAAT